MAKASNSKGRKSDAKSRQDGAEREMRDPSVKETRNIRPRPEAKPRRAQRRRSQRKSKEYPDYAVTDPQQIADGPDVILDVPVAKVDEIDIEVEDLRAQVAIIAEVRKILMLSVGADARLGQVELKIEGVEAQALVKARLKNVHAILERVAVTLDRNPQLLAALGRGVEEIGHGTGEMLADTGEGVEQVGEGGEETLEEVGKGAGEAVGHVGTGARRGVGEMGKGAGGAVGSVGRGAGQAVSDVGGGARRGVAGTGRGVKQGVAGVTGKRR
ncbi:MAG TPA: hypothetical protein VK920_11965 [Solirubrobacterales bacterium]|nr:hypothetical protein [Solirubrobacterales bacterium]